MLRTLITRSSAIHCVAPTGRKGRHCGKRKRLGRLADGVTCGDVDCQIWYSARDL